ncbi:MAG: DUF6089 family protein [Bacteroidota bacterium]
MFIGQTPPKAGCALCLFLFFLPINSYSQIPIEAGLFLGTTTYQGDLAEDHIEFKELNFAFGGFMRYHYGYHFKLRGNVVYGRISGSDLNAKDVDLYQRGWNFNSHVVEMALMLEYHRFGRNRVNEVGLFWKQFSPYIATGIGVANFDPNINESNLAFRGNFPEVGAKTSTLILPVVAGLQLDLYSHWMATIEFGSRFTFNDHLDGVSRNGNPDKNDLYIFVGVSLSYYLGYEEDFNLW